MITEIKQPDLNAPRFRPKRKCLITDEFVKRLKEKHPEYKHLNKSQIREIIITHNIVLWQTATENRDGIELNEGLGYIFVGTCKPLNRDNPNYKVSFAYKTRLRHRNFESDQYTAKIFYTNYPSKYKLRDRQLWEFKGHRDFTRHVSAVYPKNWKMYIQVENYLRINKLYKKHTTKLYLDKKDNLQLENYNEFEID